MKQTQYLAAASRPDISFILCVLAYNEEDARERFRLMLAPWLFDMWMASGGRIMERQAWMDEVGWTNARGD